MNPGEQPSLAPASGLEGVAAPLVFTRLAVGIDNHRYDVFLSPRWQEQARRFLFEQILHQAQPYLRDLQPSHSRSRSAATAEFKTLTTQVSQTALHQAKEANNIELDLLARLTLIKYLRAEMQQQFSLLASACKEQVEKGGSLALPGNRLLLQSRIAAYQAHRRHILRAVAETLFQILEELEETALERARAALLGSAFPDLYTVLRNRLLWLENPYDSWVLLEHYVMLGHFTQDSDHEEQLCKLLAGLLRECGPALPEGEAVAAAEQERRRVREQLAETERRLEEAERRGGEAAPASGLRRLRWFSGAGRGDETGDDASGLTREELDGRKRELAAELEELDSKMGLLQESFQRRLAVLLREQESAERLFGALSSTGAPLPRTPSQEALLSELQKRLERAGLLKHALAGYHLKSFYKEFCPPLNPQQLKYAVVDRQAWRKLETLLDQFPTQDFPVEKLQGVVRRLRRLRRAEVEALLVRAVRDLMRLRRDTYHRECLLDLQERIHLVSDEKARHVSRLNRTLHEFLLPDEREAGEERVLTHVVIKADVRDSTRITDELLSRGLNPATHFSLNFYEPVRKLMARYSAFKVFIEGDALILGIYETEADRAFQRPVAKACLLAKEIVQVCQVYNDRARAINLPALELGLGIAFQASAPHYWQEGDSRILISSAINRSDRLAGCTRMARRLVGGNHTPFRVFQFQTLPTLSQGMPDEEEEELLIRYNVMGVALNDEGFAKLRQEISLRAVQIEKDVLGRTETLTLYCGTVPLGSSFERIIVRQAQVPQVRLPGAQVEKWTPRVYYEVCVDSELYQQFPESPPEDPATL